MPPNRKLSRREWIDVLLAAAEAASVEQQPQKRKPPKKRGPMRDNSRNIAVHMTEAQYQRLRQYMTLTHHGVTLYFRKLIDGDRMLGNRIGQHGDMYAGVNMIGSNVRQIARNPYARELDSEAVNKMEFLYKKLSDEVYYLSCYE